MYSPACVCHSDRPSNSVNSRKNCANRRSVATGWANRPDRAPDENLGAELYLGSLQYLPDQNRAVNVKRVQRLYRIEESQVRTRVKRGKHLECSASPSLFN